MKLRKKLGLGKKVAPPPVVGETESWSVLERAEVVAQGRDVGRRREMVVEREMGKLPLPGEEDHEEVEGGIAYDGSSRCVGALCATESPLTCHAKLSH